MADGVTAAPESEPELEPEPQKVKNQVQKLLQDEPTLMRLQEDYKLALAERCTTVARLVCPRISLTVSPLTTSRSAMPAGWKRPDNLQARS